jgi:hypothetical protein
MRHIELRQKIMAAAELSGLAVDQFIEDPGVSGGKPLADRPEGGPLLDRLWTGLSATRPMRWRRRNSSRRAR